jgi:hypothetical protein
MRDRRNGHGSASLPERNPVPTFECYAGGSSRCARLPEDRPVEAGFSAPPNSPPIHSPTRGSHPHDVMRTNRKTTRTISFHVRPNTLVVVAQDRRGLYGVVPARVGLVVRSGSSTTRSSPEEALHTQACVARATDGRDSLAGSCTVWRR